MKTITKSILLFLAVLVMPLLVSNYAGAETPEDTTPSYTASLTTDRSAGQCSYTIKGLDITQTNTITLYVTGDKNTLLLSQGIELTEENCVDGTYNGTFSLADVNNTYEKLTVTVMVGTTSVNVGTCDFSIHTDKIAFSITGKKSDAKRSLKMSSTETAGEVLVPGEGNQVSVIAWPSSSTESAAKTIGAKTNVTGSGLVWSFNVSQGGVQYGTWNAKLLLTNTKNSSLNKTLASTTYEVNPTYGLLKVIKTNTLEKKKAFRIRLKDFYNPFNVASVKFNIYNSKGSKVYTATAKIKDTAKTFYYSTIYLKKLKYSLEQYTVKTVITDVNGSNKTLDTVLTADERVQKGTLSVTKKKNAKCFYKLTGAYVPGNIKKITFAIYKTSSKKKKIGVYKATKSSSKYKLTLKNAQTGSFKVKAYAYTNWGTKVLLNSQTYTLRKKDMGKTGWYYEKYNGKKYKFYYVNNVKQKDLTKVLKLKKSSSSNTNKFYIEINRAACVVTVYMYDEDTKKYDIPVKTCTVSVGRDVSTVAGTGGLNTSSSYTPIGTYSVGVKYSLKPMYEPDGSTVYARWASHIVGNVYFHSIAVGSQSHYALSSYNYNRLGSPASAGCIRMTVADAKWIYDYASAGSTIKIVKGKSSKPGPLGKNKTIKINGVSYDPTDPAVPLSRKKADYKAGRISGYMKKNGEKVGY